MINATFQPAKRQGAPSLKLLGTEAFRAAIEYADSKIRAPRTGADGDGHPVIVFPGLGGAHRSVGPLTAFCRSLGYEAYHWGRGLNRGPRGDVDAWMQELAAHVQSLPAKSGRRMTLIGWSLGGIYAREVAKILKGRVRRVITIGTPFAAGPQHTHAALAYTLLSGQPAHHDPRTARRLLVPPSVPTTCIYSRDDGVVAWQACMQPNPPGHVDNVEVPGSHCGMGWNRHVLAVVAERLVLPAGRGPAPSRATKAGSESGRGQSGAFVSARSSFASTPG